MLTTTLKRIRANRPCEHGWARLLRSLGKSSADDEPIPYKFIVESNGIDDALWCCRAEPGLSIEWRLFAVWCARRAVGFCSDKYSNAAIDTAERYANGLADDVELKLAFSKARYEHRHIPSYERNVSAEFAAQDCSRNDIGIYVFDAFLHSVVAVGFDAGSKSDSSISDQLFAAKVAELKEAAIQTEKFIEIVS